MPLFQPSVLKSHLALLDQKSIDKAYKNFALYFLDLNVQDEIKTAKEEQFQATFLMKLFVNVFNYTLFPDTHYNLITEQKNETNARKADGAILKGDTVTAVIELKGTKTKDLESIRKQAFDYKNFNTGCTYVITSNFEKLRFYIEDASTYEEFDLFTLSRKQFELLYLCLHKDQLLQHVPKTIKEESLVAEEKITKSFYKDYSLFKRELWKDLAKHNVKSLKELAAQHRSVENEIIDGVTTAGDDDLNQLEKNVKRTLFKKSQKLIDRFLFIFFAEDRGLLQPNYTLNSIAEWETVRKLGIEESLYDRFKKHFNYLDQGRKRSDGISEIFAYNGGLFKPDLILDHLIISDDLLLKHTKKIATYDFESQVDVNILGHIFENSLNEIESVNAAIDGADFDKQTSKRKKDGVFYTPKYITKYIVDNTVGKLCEEKKTALGFAEEEYYRGRKNRNKTTLENLVNILDDYREWLLQLTICDPACGSGAFLNQALDFLITEHHYIDELKAKLLGQSMTMSDIENTILENNIYGVDLNEESVEIAKLSLWLRTAQPRRKLNDLSSNIKCGNSLIDVKAVAGDKAFKWEEEFPQVFEKGGFDVVIGNPPYVSSKDGNFTSVEKDYYLKKYETSVYQIDLYILFIERCSILINKRGLTSLIIPNAWLNNIFLSPVREKLLNEYYLYELVEMPSKTFIDASVDTMILNYGLIRRDSLTKVSYFLDSQLLNKFSIDQKDWQSEDNFLINLSVDKSILNCLRKIERETVKLSKVSRIGRGVGLYHKRVGHTKEFILNDPYQSNKKENETFKPYLKGRNINRFSLNWQQDNYVSYGNWLAEPRDMDFFTGNRILLRQIPSKLLFATELNELFITDQSVFIAKFSEDSSYDSRGILGIVNSKLMSFYFRFKHSEFDDLFPKVKLQHFKDFPIKQSSTLLNNSVNKIKLLASLEIKNNHKFQNYFQQSLELEKLSKKLQNWHELDFGDFIKELNKAIKAQNRIAAKEAIIDLGEKEGELRESTHVHLIPELTKKDEFEWMELFEEKKKEVLELQSQINQTEQEIDQMVYELYGLSDEEIKIVEGS